MSASGRDHASAQEGSGHTEHLGAYIPMDRRQAMAGGRTLADRTTGAALIADISGFTPLTEALVGAYGPRRGAEELTVALDRVYDALVEAVHDRRGSVIGFSGDAITCWFDGDDGRRAAASGLAMQRAMADFARLEIPGADPVELSVKVAAVAGPVRQFIVGDPAIQFFAVIAGATVDRLGALSERVVRGEVALDAATATALGEALTIAEWRGDDGDGSRHAIATAIEAEAADPWPALADDALPAVEIRPWILAPVYERLASGQGAFLAEFRPGVSVFLRFGGIDWQADDAGARLDGYIRHVQGILAGYEGTLVDVTIGDKGSYLSIVFGAPIAHEEDALRAAAAALELRESQPEPAAPEPVGHETAAPGIGPVQIGISRGRIRAGAFGGRNRRAYAVQGLEVNVAARLMSKAQPGQIVVSERVATAIGGRFGAAPLGPIAVKGLAAPLEAFELRAHAADPADLAAATLARPALARAVPLVGRAAELATLAAALEAAVGGASPAVVVAGEPGVGKSRLVEAILDRAREREVAVLAAAGNPIDRSTPYLAWRPLFGALVGGPAGGDSLADVLARLPSEDRERAPLLAGIVAGAPPETDLTRTLTPEARQENTLRLLAALFEARRPAGPVVLVVDDAQWLDSASRALLPRLARGDRLLVLATSRLDVASEAGLDALVASIEAERLDLAPLGAGDSLDLVARSLGGDALPESVERFIVGRGGGHPFFSLELGYALRDAGLVALEGGRIRLRPGADLDSIEFPDSIEGVITTRVDRVSPEAQTVLKVASVVGPAFSAPVVAELRAPEPVDPTAPERERAASNGLGGALRELTAVDLIEPDDGPGPTGEAYRFRHALIRDAVYGRLLFAQRRQLHRRAAEVLEREGRSSGTPLHGRLAHHWELAEVPDRAIEHLEVAGEDALRDGAFLESASFLDRALAIDERRPTTGDDGAPAAALAVDDARKARWQWTAAWANYRLGNLDRSRAMAEAAVAILDRPIPEAGARLGLAVGGQITRQFAHRLMPRRFIDTAPEADREDLRRAVRSLFNLAEVYYLASLVNRSAYAALRGLNLAERTGPSLELVEAYGAICIIAGLVGQHGLARRYAALGRATAEQVGLPYATAINRHQVGLYRSGVGPAGTVQATFEESAALFRTLGDKGRLRDCVGLAGIAASIFGWHEAGERWLHELLETHEPGERSLGQTWANLWLGTMAFRQGRVGEARELAERALGAGPPEGLDMSTIDVHGLLALCALEDGRLDDARVSLDRARALIAETGGRPSGHPVIDGYDAVARVSLAFLDRATSEADQALWRRRVVESIGYLRAYRALFPIGEPALRRAEAELAIRLDRTTEAVRAWRRSLAAAEELDMRYDLGLAHRGLAAILPPDDPDRDRHAAAAGEGAS